LKIPKSARIRKTVYEVKRVPTLAGNHQHGEIDYKELEIRIAAFFKKAGKKIRITKEEQWEAFWHEVVHGILRDMGRHDLNNERFVTAFCRRLYGVLKGK